MKIVSDVHDNIKAYLQLADNNGNIATADYYIIYKYSYWDNTGKKEFEATKLNEEKQEDKEILL